MDLTDDLRGWRRRQRTQEEYPVGGGRRLFERQLGRNARGTSREEFLGSRWGRGVEGSDSANFVCGAGLESAEVAAGGCL